MRNATFSSDPDLPLEIGGYEANTGQNVFVLTRSLEPHLKGILGCKGYVQRANIVLSDGRILDGWVKI